MRKATIKQMLYTYLSRNGEKNTEEIRKHMNKVVPKGVSMPILCNMLAKDPRYYKIPYTVNRRIDGVRIRLASWGVKDVEEE
mgnify:CR=1 FL=1